MAQGCILARGKLQQVANRQEHGVVAFGRNSFNKALEESVRGCNSEIETQLVAYLNLHVKNHFAGVCAVANELEIKTKC